MKTMFAYKCTNHFIVVINCNIRAPMFFIAMTHKKIKIFALIFFSKWIRKQKDEIRISILSTSEKNKFDGKCTSIQSTINFCFRCKMWLRKTIHMKNGIDKNKETNDKSKVIYKFFFEKKVLEEIKNVWNKNMYIN